MPKPSSEGARIVVKAEESSSPDVSVVIRYVDVSIVGGSAEVQQQLKQTGARIAELLGLAPPPPDTGGSHG